MASQCYVIAFLCIVACIIKASHVSYLFLLGIFDRKMQKVVHDIPQAFSATQRSTRLCHIQGINWSHTGSNECRNHWCQKHYSARHDCWYKFNNSLITRPFLKSKHDWKATRIRMDEAIISWFEHTKPNGDVLGISGDNYFNLVEPSSSTFTTADYPHIDCQHMPYEDGMFDLVILNQVLEHVPRPWLCVNEVHRVLRAGGHIVVGAPAFYQEHLWPHDYWRFMPDSMSILLADFNKIIVQGQSGTGDMMKHMINNPSDRRSTHFFELARASNEKLWPCMVWAIAVK
mmetsp:Transcript_47706/g.91143  ORF Transcript_47706/g.91143 Transcript_47706/m.91143 type:complete len:287 (-) Transcript_47706:651-1511(-)